MKNQNQNTENLSERSPNRRLNTVIVGNRSSLLKRLANMKIYTNLHVISLVGMFFLFSIVFQLESEEHNGKFVVAIREPLQNEDGFRAITSTLERGRDTSNWWEYYQYNICSMNPDGTDFQRLTDDAVSYNPRWAPDRKHIAYISGIQRSKSLYVMSADGTEKKQLIKREYDIHDYWWSPKSDAVLVVVEIDRPKDRLENWAVTIEGKIKRWRSERWAKGWLHWDQNGEMVKEPNRRLLEVLPKGISWPEWSPDKRWIAFKTDGLLALAEPNVVSMGRSWFLQLNEPPCANIEEWSPDGKHILFYTSGEICTVSVEKGKIQNYKNLSLYPGREATWSPDGTYVAFIGSDSNRRRTSEIFIIHVESGKMEQITSTIYDFINLHWR